MRTRALVLTALLIISSAASVIASDTTTTQDVELSGNHILTGNYTVSHGTTLTLRTGTVLDMQNYWLEVEGTLIADNSTIMSSIQTTSPGSHNAGVWDSLTITSIGTAVLDNVTISNAKSCIIVEGIMTATGLTIEDCLIGIEVDGTATISDMTSSHIDHDGVRVTGDADISGAIFTDMSGGIHSNGDLILTDGEFTDVGTGLSLTGGTADVEVLNFNSGVGNGVSISSGVSGDVDGMTGHSTNAIVSMDSSGFSFSNLDMSGDRLVNSWSAGDLSISNAVFDADSGETPIDMRTSGTVTLTNIELTGQFSSQQGTYNAPWIGIAIAGSGDYIIDDSWIESTDTALKASGTGTLTITESTFTSDRVGLSFSGISSTTLDDVVVNISTGGEMGIDILQGIHSFSELEVNMPFNQFTSGSTGIDAWWCEITAEDIAVNGFANSMEIYESILTAEDLLLLDSSIQGLYASSSAITVTDSFETRVSDSGLVMISSTAVFRTWAASYHEDGGVIDSNSEVIAWQLSSISNLDSDVTGDGTISYGTSQALTIDTATSNRLWEMTISFEDLTGNPVDANWEVLGFQGTAIAGEGILPVSETGSKITATYSGVGALSTPVGVQGGSHTIQVPIMPQGDWALVGGTVVVLGPTEDGTPHIAGGNVTVPPNAQLILQDTTLQLPNYATITIDNYGDLEGYNSQLIGEVISLSSEFGDSQSSNLTIIGDVFWSSCQTDANLFGLQIEGDIQLDNSCKVTINSGGVTGQVDVGVGATFEIVNTLEVTVLDKGEPVQGATITVQGQSVTTDAAGKATKSTTAILVDTSGTTTAGLKQVSMQWGSISDLMAWDPSSSKEHTFTASTISGGTLSEWLVLEKAWSPYHLTSNLIIPQGQTMTINDGVSLRVADGVTISVEGTFNSGYSTISSMGGGARWGGLIVGDNTETSASLLGTSLVEGSPLLTLDGNADVVLSNGLLSRSSGAEPLIRLNNSATGSMQIVSTTLSDSASHCIEAQGSALLSMQQVSMQTCATNSLWARSLPLSIDGLLVTEKVDLNGVTGEMDNFEGGELNINNLDGFMMSNLVLTSLNGSDNREIIIDGAVIEPNITYNVKLDVYAYNATTNATYVIYNDFTVFTATSNTDTGWWNIPNGTLAAGCYYASIGLYDDNNGMHYTEDGFDLGVEMECSGGSGNNDNAMKWIQASPSANNTFLSDSSIYIDWLAGDLNGPPAAELENSAGSISHLTIDCGGSGVGLSSHHGRASAPLTISDSSISSCTKGIDLHTDGESAAIVLNDVNIDSMVAISSDGNDIIVHNGILNGSLDVDSAKADIYDVIPLSESTTSGEIWMWNTHVLDVRLSGTAYSANIELAVANSWSNSVTGSSIEVALPHTIVSDSGTEMNNVVDIVATSEGLPTLSEQYSFGPTESNIIQINMISNQAPEVEIIIPDDGFTIMESLPIEIRAVISDDLDSNEDLEITWIASIGQTEMMRTTGEWNNITDLPAGMYVLKLEVTDTQGSMSSQSLFFEITLLDSDGDWINTCKIDTWYDKDEDLNCGPDVYDIDDDNDGVIDIRDPWPADPCASMDTDGDGQPDNIHCPIGFTTWLTVDSDDDGDGIPDASEGTASGEDSSASPMVIVLFVGLFLAAAAFMLMRSKQEVE
jgi:hypothetical protein